MQPKNSWAIMLHHITFLYSGSNEKSFYHPLKEHAYLEKLISSKYIHDVIKVKKKKNNFINLKCITYIIRVFGSVVMFIF